MNEDITYYLDDFTRITTLNHHNNEFFEKLTRWSKKVDEFFFCVQTNMISGHMYKRVTTDRDDDNSKHIAERSKLQQQSVDAMEAIILDVILKSKDSDSIPDDPNLEAAICSLRNIYRLVLLLNENDVNLALLFCKKIKSREILGFFLHLLSQKGSANSVIAVHASMALFQSMRNDRETTDLFLQLNGLPVLLQALIRGSSVALKVSLVKHLHQLLGYGVSERMISILNMMNDTITEELKNRDSPRKNVDLVQLLIVTAAWCLRSSIFPGDQSDQRADLLEEIMNVLFLLQPTYSGDLVRFMKDKPSDEEKKEFLTQIGVLVCDILNLCSRDSRSYRCKLATVMLLMEMPLDYSQFLYINGGVDRLFEILEIQLSEFTIEKRKNASVAVIPILVVFNKLTGFDNTIKIFSKDRIFPKNDDKDALVEDQKKEGYKSQTLMHPDDAPYGTLRWKLIELMTCNDSNVKRVASELLWNICDDPGDFVKRTGYGNAVHMLGIKGLVQLPNQQ